MSISKTIDADEINKWIQLVKRFWYVWLLIFTIIITTTLIYNNVSTNTYSVNAQILIKSESNAAAVMGFSMKSSTINNDIAVLKSYELIKATINTCPFTISYFENKGFTKEEVYPNSHYEVSLNHQHVQIVDIPFNIDNCSDSTIHLSIKQADATVYDLLQNKKIALTTIKYDTIIKIGQTFKTDFCDFTINKNTKLIDCEKSCSFTINSLESIIRDYQSIDTKLEPSSGIVNISVQTNCHTKAIIFLNKLISQYYEHSIERQNIIANNTMTLIDTLLEEIRDSLYTSEDLIKNFKKEKRLLNIDFQSQKSFSKLNEIEKQRADLILQRTYLLRSLKFLQDSPTQDVFALPPMLDASNGLLNKFLDEYNSAVALKKEIKLNTIKDPPYLSALEARISNARNAVMNAMEKLSEDLTYSIDETEQKIDKLYKAIDSIPQTDRDLTRIERRFHLHEGLYTFLLQKQSEMQIIKAGNIPIDETLEHARQDNVIFLGPQKTSNMIKSILLSFAICIGLLYILRITFNKITSAKEVENLQIDNSIFASIYHNNEQGNIVITNGTHTPVAESFRTLQANFQFFPKVDSTCRVCAITSSDMGEGKSFVSINLAYSLATNNKKVALLGLDLRRPSLHNYLGINNSNYGISSYLAGAYNLEKIIHKTDNDLLHFLNAGPIPPNPTDLLGSESMKQLIEELKNRYDYVIIDTPPVGRVGDFLYITPLADTLFYIIRHNTSSRPFVNQNIDFLNQKGIKNLSIIYNDCPIKKGKYGYYTYGYYQ